MSGKVLSIGSSTDELMPYLKGLRNAMKVTVIAGLLVTSRQTVYEWVNRGSLTAFDFDGLIGIKRYCLYRMTQM